MMQDPDLLLKEAEALLEARNVGRALNLLDAAEAAGADPDRCSAGCWTAQMLLGDFEAAWCQSDAIRRRGAPDPHRFWTGEAIDGKRAIVRCLHGFGDSVQMLRYASKLRACAARLIVEVAPPFIELARCFEGVDEVITWGEQASPSSPHWDVQMEVTELPYFFRTTVSKLPGAQHYLHLPPAADLTRKAGTANKLRVGLVWASGSWNPSRSVPLELLRPLLLACDCEFWNLQGGDALQDAAALRDLPNIHNDPQSADCMLRLAQVIAQMDLVITPDTLAAHLAGALNVPACIMLQHAADWRWMLDRDDSPWYPSLRLFRQKVQGDWTSVIQCVQRHLTTMLTEQGRITGNLK